MWMLGIEPESCEEQPVLLTTGKSLYPLYSFFFLICMGVLTACMSMYTYAMCMPGAHRDQKRKLTPLGLELYVVDNCPVGAGN